ncbi:MAG: hypothetical protein LJE67_04280, partial [Salaquimonas sp.]|nr:hypothetical protein [Salaquimonas sp.]
MPVDRYLFGADNAESQKLDARIAELEDKLAKAEKDTAVPLDTRPAVDEEVARLKAQLGLAENVTTDLQTQLDKAQNEDIPALK